MSEILSPYNPASQDQSYSQDNNRLDSWLGFGTNLFTGLGSMAYQMYRNWRNDRREDTAVQRRVADLQAAGLNPLLAAGSAANSTVGGSLNTAPLQSSADQLFSRKIQRESYRQQQWITAQERIKAQILQNDLYGGQLQSALDTGAFTALVSPGRSKVFVRPGQNMYTNMFDNITKTNANDALMDYLLSQYEYKHLQFENKTQKITDSLGLFGDLLAPALDIMDTISKVRGAFGSRRGNGGYSTFNRRY